MSGMKETREKVLILCIDSDNDVGIKAEVDTPVIGRDANIEAATKLALKDPEEADANSMFASVKIMDTLSTKEASSEYEVATISGSEAGGLEADRKIAHELQEVLERFSANGVIFVSDGYADESIIPIIQSRVPIVSLRHVVVKHSERLEETWAVLLRYGRMMVNNTRYSRFSLGVPGILLIAFGLLYVFNQLQNAGVVLLFVLGGALVVKGFGLDEKITLLVPTTPADQLKLATRVAGLVLVIVGCYVGGANAASFVSSDAPPFWINPWYWFSLTPTLIGHFLMRGLDLITIGAVFSFVGGMIYFFMRKDARLWRNVVGINISFWLRFILIEAADVLIAPQATVTLYSPLVIMTIASVATTTALVLVIYRTNRFHSFEKGDSR
jgi:putative membrane protein